MAEALDVSALPYRPCVGIVLQHPDGRVFAGQRVDQTDAWQMPQGGVDKGEDPGDAALRELFEETNVTADKAELIAETADWLPYELPDTLIPRLWGGKYRGQTQKWFLFRFLGRDADIDIAAGDQEFSAGQWMEIDALMAQIVPFKRPVYSAVFAEFRAML